MNRSHPASDRKRRRLRASGDVVPTGDLAGPAALLVAAALAVLVGSPLLRALAEGLAAVLRSPGPEGLQVAADMFRRAGLLVAGLVVTAGLAGALVPWAAAGFLWAPARLGPGLRPRLQLAPEAAGGVVAGALVGLACLWALAGAAGALAAASDPVVAALGGAHLLRKAVLVGGLAAVLQGLVRHLMARRVYERRIRMTDEERRREAQEDQGHPAVRRAREELAARALQQAVPAGDGSAARGMVDMGGPEGPRP
jgi:flagellar biosynthesis protein FlhB